MKFNRILLIVVSLALMLFALAGCGKDAAQDNQKKIKCCSYYYNVNGFSKKKLAVTMCLYKGSWGLA